MPVDKNIFPRTRPLAQLFDRFHPFTQILEGPKGAHHPGHRIAVGNPDSLVAEQQRGQHHVLSVRSAAQEGKIGGRGQFRIKAHGNTPCRYQRTGSVPMP